MIWLRDAALEDFAEWQVRFNAADNLTEKLYDYGRQGCYKNVIENLDLLNEQGIGGCIGHLRRMQAQSRSDAEHEEVHNKKAQLCGMSDGWGELAARLEAVLSTWVEAQCSGATRASPI